MAMHIATEKITEHPQSQTLPSIQCNDGDDQQRRSRTGKFSISGWSLPLFKSADKVAPIRLPPRPPGRSFSQEYEVVLLVDQREQFSSMSQGQHLSRAESAPAHLEWIRAKGVSVELRQLPQGDALWVARSRFSPTQEYVLDFIVERKRADDLVKSIRDRRYEQQKYWLTRCGITNKVYLVEGDLDYINYGQCGKTAMVTTEVLDGFSVLCTDGIHSTFALYSRLTHAIQELYDCSEEPLSGDPPQPGTGMDNAEEGAAPLMTYSEFQKRLTDMKKLTVRDIWGLMLTRIRGVGQDAAEAILRQYPTPISLWRAYQSIMAAAISGGTDATAQAQQMLRDIPTSALRKIGPSTSKKVFECLFSDQCNPMS